MPTIDQDNVPHALGFDVTVDPKDARIALTSPVQANEPKNLDYLNGGHDSAPTNILGAGLTYPFAPATALGH